MGNFDHLIHEFELPLSNPVLIFSLILFIILLAPILLKKLRLPGIIGLIISGVVIGPHGLNVLEQNDAITLFSTVGLLYIMFIAGIELDMFEFKRNRHKSLGFGFFTFIFPLALGIPICYYLLDYGFTASILISSMFATHTLVAYPIATKFGISKDQAVAITVGGTILTDTAVLIILAVITGSANGGLTPEFWVSLSISLAIFLLIVFLILPRIATWFFTNLQEDRISHYVLVLSLVFFAAFLAEAAGVEAIIGAFMAGLALNRLIPHTSALMNRIEFVGNAIFIPFFLINVGMLVDLSILFRGPDAIIIALTLSAVALAGKYIAAFVTQKTFRYSAHQRQLIFGLSSAHAAATLAVILVGYRAGIIDENILNGTIILILITCIVASFVTEHAAKKVARDHDNLESLETEAPPQEENVLIPIANFKNLEPLVDLAVLFKPKKRSFTIHILTVVKYDSEAEVNMQKVKRKLDYFVQYLSATDTTLNPVVTFDVNTAEGIIRKSREVMAEIFIMGWPQKRTFLSRIFSQITETIISSTDKTILFCNIRRPVNTTKTIKVVCPPNAELEPGFYYWLNKLRLLAAQLRSETIFFCSKKTRTGISSIVKKSIPPIKYHAFPDLSDFLVLAREVKTDDLLVVVSAREDSISYHGELRKMPEKLNKYFKDYNMLLIYPGLKDEVGQSIVREKQMVTES
ncbi:Na+/H+ antiporter [Fulvivirga imtechensis AK7]|uniref:Na+/H+ antiporter n=1 Tax=Fulvivirga imtechensis AK7 TaxID=1237149 RepID=L8JXZ9_9BACT|nr:cation:proton antiporter [Fulvivirga imtechensis]ELR73048.1 Na+/H+ antiporter [Fulvivirga imtechensis AK7]